MVNLPDFTSVVGRDNVLDDIQSRKYYSRDIFLWPDAPITLAVVVPSTSAEVSAVVRMATQAGLAIVARGGGMSYSGGYVPQQANSVTLDLRRLNRVREINTQDQYVTIEAGSSWIALTEALASTGMRPVFKLPYSGIVSTVGGALSQGTADEMSGILSLELVLPNGEVLRTGSAAVSHDSVPFFRNFGPDIAGLFIADGGRLGIKTAATIALEPAPRARGYISFAFDTFGSLMRGMVACSQLRLPGRMMGLDPRKSQNAPRVGFKDAISTLASVAIAKGGVGGGLLDAMKMAAAGRNFMEGVLWSLHVTAEGVSEQAVQDSLMLLRAAGTREGREIPNLLPMALAAKPYSVRGFLGPEGERWVPTNAILPYSRAEAAADAVQKFFDSQRPRMNELGFWESYMLGPRPGFVVLEPSFYWRDEVSQLHLDNLDATSAAKFRGYSADSVAQAFARDLRDGLIETLDHAGAVHVQMAKTYAYESRLTPEAKRMWVTVRDALDPQGLMNPGNLSN